MYLAQINTLETQAPFYINIIKDVINNNNLESKENIDNAIIEAKKVVEGEKDLFSIDNNHYFLITTLLSKYEDKLKNININNFTNQIYIDILDLLK